MIQEIKTKRAKNLLSRSKKYITESIKGLKRKENQDNYLVIEYPSYSLYFVFDGVSSAVNSKKATILSKKFISLNHSSFFKNHLFDLSGLMYETNDFLLHQGLPELKTTFCSICILNNKDDCIQFSSLGDSRAYIINPQYIAQITEDDRYLSSKHAITKCLGMVDLDKEDFYQKDYLLNEKDQILLCTDGFYNVMEENKGIFFQAVLKQSMVLIQKRFHNLIKGDNIDDSTYILIK